MNDIHIISSIIIIFLLVGTILPFIQEDFPEYTDIDAGNGTAVISDLETANISAVGVLDILSSIGLMFFWTFGAIPWFIDIIFVFMRIVFFLTIARNIWIGGGG